MVTDDGFGRRYGADLAALLAVTIWGVSFVFQKVTLEELDPLAFTFARFVGMLALGWGVLLWRRVGGSPISVARADLAGLALAGILGYSLYILLSTVALSYTTAFSNALLIATAPIFAALLLRALGIERIAVGQIVAMAASLFGVVVFLGEKVQVGLRGASLGDLISLVAAFFFAAYSVANKPLVARYPVSVAMAYTLTIGAVPVLLISLPATLAQDWSGVSAAGWAGLAWSIVVPVYVAWTVWSWAIARVGVARTSVFMYLVPLIGGLASWSILGEAFSPLKMAGALLVLGGLILARWASTGPAESLRPIRAAPAPARICTVLLVKTRSRAGLPRGQGAR